MKESQKQKRTRLRIFQAGVLSLILAGNALSQSQPFLKITVKDSHGSSRVSFSSDAPLPFSLEKKPAALLIVIATTGSLRIRQDSFQSEIVKSVGWSKGRKGYVFSIDLRKAGFEYESSTGKAPFELIIDLRPVQEVKEPPLISAPVAGLESSAGEKGVSAPVAGIATVTAGESKKFRTIVIDPGHGGIETGAKGKFGALEKNIALAISLKLKAVIEKNLAFRVILTRDTDTDVSLENRSAVANNHKSDLFISVHANASRRKNARGSETYFLSLNATDEEARRLAYLENSSSRLEGQIEEENKDEIKMILWDLAQSSYLKQSSQLAEMIQSGLNELLGTQNRGIKQAPFKVLTGVACPAVLVEVAFISNPEEEKNLQAEDFQDNVARAIYQSLVGYLKLYP